MIIHAPTFTKSLLKKVAAVTATLSIALSVSACGNAEGSKNAANAGAFNGTLVVDADINIVTLDPARSFETATLPVLRAAYQTA